MSDHGTKLWTRFKIVDATPAWKVRRTLDNLMAEFGDDAEVSLGADPFLGRYLEVKRRPEPVLRLLPTPAAPEPTRHEKETRA